MDNIIVINIWNRNTWRCSSFIFRCTRSRIIQILSCCSAGACSKQNRLIACRASFSLIRSNRLWFFYYFQNIISKKLTFLALNEICTTSSTPIQFFLDLDRGACVWHGDAKKMVTHWALILVTKTNHYIQLKRTIII